MPESRWRKFRATRSPRRMGWSGPATWAMVAPAAISIPSITAAIHWTRGSTTWYVSCAKVSPQITPDCFAITVPRPNWSVGTSALVVRS